MITLSGVDFSQVQAGLAQARLIVGARQLQAPQGNSGGQAAALPLEARASSAQQRCNNAVQPQVSAETGQLVLQGALRALDMRAQLRQVSRRSLVDKLWCLVVAIVSVMDILWPVHLADAFSQRCAPEEGMLCLRGCFLILGLPCMPT